MQCSWKSMMLLVLASIAIQYTAIRTFSTKPLSLLYSVGLAPRGHAVNCSLKDLTKLGQETAESSDQGCDETRTPSSPAPTSDSSNANKRTHILILATTRSGSSFVGQLFNQHPEVFYMFEPLYHVQLALLPRLSQSRNLAERRVMLGAARELLRSLYHCQLNSLESYIRPRPSNHTTDKLFRRGASRSLCSPPVCEASLGREAQSLVLTDEGECGRRCGALNLSLAADTCSTKQHAAIKTVRIPQISDLRALIEDSRLNLKVVQLVRDPRGILASRIETFRDTYRLWRLWRATGRRPHNLDLGQINAVCEDFLRSVSTGLARPAWLRGRYMLLRYEDLARFPLQKARELYGFLGLDLDHSVEEWIINNTRGSSDLSSRQKFTTVRDSAANAENWRLKLSFDMVVYTQTACQPLLELLGYKRVFHPKELRNLSHSLVEDRTFLPFI
ncbi:carbohydrate sulfotransferase 1 [Notolabrus celidotus]|uniref:carbohydrate sulfotransferase 1 n=1 Tax=Notolabrus celidotus TaxID=1203425 RepID=UPI0014906C9D|nr:carbohydrate sulfotransferase 1 [Notolabrus celidotus]XP_034541042.1 carbohydrate sulfotransferase 1 [Notolabrus celidotus]XP_034541043.1 carbohydrate sulfotransferase 1 [Notolabrus celidotus]XP_034541045.1 carbohydrate sulfotransferase 1 [Notolabrus celidotus]